jgi:UDP-N-acetylglucosamine 2-epimerase (non-hydrolysing)
MVKQKIKIMSVFGTRPEAIKMAPVVRLLAETPAIDSRVCVTAQHRGMLDQVLELFDIKPDFDLNLMRENQSLAELSATIFTTLDSVLVDFNPDWVLVQGDTTTVAISSLLSYYRRIKVGHVEAGLRTYDKWQPFPEEINRRIAGVVADLHFAPTEMARQNLINEGIPDRLIRVTGNPVIDALIMVGKRAEPRSVSHLLSQLSVAQAAHPKRLILVTAHRRENFGKPLENICQALKEIAARGDVEIVYPVHLNPNVQETVKSILQDVSHITLLPPLDYLPLIHMIKQAFIILTDSGGIQEEAPVFGKPVLVLRNVTERPEGVIAGTLKLVGSETDNIIQETRKLLENPVEYDAMAKASNPFGDGHAAERIVNALLE